MNGFSNGRNGSAPSQGYNNFSYHQRRKPSKEHAQELRVATIAALSQQMKGDSRHGLYGNASKRDYYERGGVGGGHVAVCSRGQAVALTVFVFSAIFFTSLAVAFIRPFSLRSVSGGPATYLDHCYGTRFFTSTDGSYLSGPATDETGSAVSGDQGDLDYEKEYTDASAWYEGEPMATNGEPFPWNNVRLPKFIRPVRYDIELTPNLTTLWVKGIEKLIFTVSQETQFIVFHSYNITIASRTINERLKVERLLEFPERQQIYLETDGIMSPGVTYAIRIKFEYKLNDRLAGFYLSTYNDKNGNERRLATTNFEPTYARWAFPCFDEPHLKAKFLMTVTHDRNLVAFFNSPKKPNSPSEVRGKPDQVRDEFEESVEMSTYLVAFVVCDFASLRDVTKHNVNVSVIASKDKINQGQFALDTATSLMDHYTEFFQVQYPLQKQDLVAIPDFPAGAMENWGLITYRENALLYSAKETSAEGKQSIAVYIAHELAHQWFGNLVTMHWWNDLWLNEGFASWMEYQAVDHIQPTWKITDQFLVDVVAPALELDSLTTSHPVSVDVTDPNEIKAIFDTISYKKGAAILHMLESAVGRDVIKAGLTRYLEEHKFSTAVTNDLWESVEEAWTEHRRQRRDRDRYVRNGSGAGGSNTTANPGTASSAVLNAISDTVIEQINMVGSQNDHFEHNFTVKELMDTWTLQTGYPIVSFVQINDTNIYSIQQSRFIAAMNLNDTSVNRRIETQGSWDTKWIIPMNYYSNLEDFQDNFILNRTHSIEVEFPADLTWFKANRNGTGFYRVNYPKENWDALTKALINDHNIFTPADRTQLLNDAFSLSRSGLLSATVPLEMCIYLLNEREVAPWKMAISHLKQWTKTLQDTDILPILNSYIQHLVSPLYNELGWRSSSSSSHREQILRNFILASAVDSGMEEAVSVALEKFDSLVKRNNEVSPNFRPIVYRCGIKNGRTSDWKYAWKMLETTRVASERSLWIRALAASSQHYNLQQYLHFAINDKVKLQDVRTIFQAVAENPSGTQIAWRELQMSWPKLVKKFGEGSSPMGQIISSTVSHFSTDYDLETVTRFFRNKRAGVGSGVRELDQAIEQIVININWRDENEGIIRQWIENKLGSQKSLMTKNTLMYR